EWRRGRRAGRHDARRRPLARRLRALPLEPTATSQASKARSTGYATLRPFVRADQPEAPPADARQPRASHRDRPWADPDRSAWHTPSGEPWSRRIDLGSPHADVFGN